MCRLQATNLCLNASDTPMRPTNSTCWLPMTPTNILNKSLSWATQPSLLIKTTIYGCTLRFWDFKANSFCKKVIYRTQKPICYCRSTKTKKRRRHGCHTLSSTRLSTVKNLMKNRRLILSKDTSALQVWINIKRDLSSHSFLDFWSHVTLPTLHPSWLNTWSRMLISYRSGCGCSGSPNS